MEINRTDIDTYVATYVFLIGSLFGKVDVINVPIGDSDA